jgi:nicotinamidase-related amidase
MSLKRLVLPLAAIAVVLSYGPSSRAQNIIHEWSSVKVPPPPTLKRVTVDPKTTALLMMDFVKQICNAKRPRCVADLPNLVKLLDAARAHGLLVIHTTVPPVPIADTLPQLAVKGNEPVIAAWVNKFTLVNKDTGLEKLLKSKGITTIIASGTNVNGAELYTSSAASLRGFHVIVPVDAMPGSSAYEEQYVAYNFVHAPIVSKNITLTSIDRIKFK